MEKLTKEWFASILAEKLANAGAQCEVTELEVLKPDADKVGDNFCSSTARIRVKFISPRSVKTSYDQNSLGDNPSIEQELHLFAKFLPNTPSHEAFVRKNRFFEREAMVYEKLFPAMLANARERLGNGHGDKGQPIVTPLWPTVYYADEDLVVMGDLSKEGFKLGEKRVGLNEKEAKLAVRAFARCHALSYSLKENSTLLPLENFRGQFGVIGTDDLFVHPSTMPLGTSKNAAAAMAAAFTAKYGHDDDKKELVQRLQDFLDVDFLQQVLTIAMKESKIDCFYLGDCWINNILIRYGTTSEDKNEPKEVRLLDFQLARWSSPLLDLVKFSYSSLSANVFSQLDKLLLDYYEHFFHVLEKLGSSLTRDLYTFEEMLEDFRQREAYGFQMSLCCLPILVMTKDDLPAEDGSSGGDLVADMALYVKSVLEGGPHPMKGMIFDRFLGHVERVAEKGLI